ncbi:MAG: choice-of-anchor Q domain-containing protein [Betaproteobacteria bacterium]
MNMNLPVVATVTLVTALVIAHSPVAIAAGGVVGSGSPPSCTEAAFDTVFARAQSSGGGIITFNCGGAAHAIVFSNLKSVATNTEIQGGNLITLSGGNTSGVFQVFANGTLKLGKLVVTRGYGAAGAIENFGRLEITDARLEGNTGTANGGAIINHADATLTNVVVTGNEAPRGGIFADGGTTTILNSQITNNVAISGGGISADGGTTTIRSSQITNNVAASGGGLYIRNAVLAIESSSIARNKATFDGGGLFLQGSTTTLLRTTIAANTARGGAGIWFNSGSLAVNEAILSDNIGSQAPKNPELLGVETGGAMYQLSGTSVLTNVSIVGNRAYEGAGISALSGPITLTNVTISGNTGGGKGPGIHLFGAKVTLTNVTVIGNSSLLSTAAVLHRTNSGTLTINSTVLANPGSSNCSAPFVGATFSYSNDGTCGFGATRDNAVLAFDPLATNGGFTLTHMPQAGNPVIDNGAGVGCPSVDQRGVTRPSGIACDAGAVEYVAGAPALATVFEYYNAGFGHYFVTLLPDEIAKLDAGVFVGWTRTGQQFNVYRSTGANLVPVCRFFTVAFPPKSSHFYAPRGFGCEGTLQNMDWQFEADVFYTPLPNAGAQCPAGHLPVYRLYNNGQGGAPNHRFTIDPVLRTQMIASEYVGEGAGVGVGMCSPQ